MNRNAEAITVLCSRLCVAEGIHPLENKEWSHLATRLLALKLRPEDLLDFDRQDYMDHLQFSNEEADRYLRLLDRSGSLRRELSRVEDRGIRVVTRADAEYPRQLKAKLGNACPPLFYYAGNISLLRRPSVGYVGSRQVDPSDVVFTERTVRATVRNGYGVVSGGAKGIDTASAVSALREGSFAIEYVSGSMLSKMRNPDVLNVIREERLLLMSVVIPTDGFDVGIAMYRNRFIYAQSVGTVVVRSDNGKGGTWAGATDNLKKGYCPVFCRDCDYPGNRGLIKRGAIPIGDDWDGKIAIPNESGSVPGSAVQISLFDDQ
ncbi:MAG: DNA-protecting protein DprA [Clostridia bacterium]|nr:DNA-protecting protein DprA [Clostridia bacterium]